MKPVAVIPAYNEASTLHGVVASAQPWVDAVIVVDDGSTDGTGDCLGSMPENVCVLRHEHNRGKAAALATGFRHALELGATHVVTLDADGQHRPEDIPRLLAAAADDPPAVVIGERQDKRSAAPAARRMANHFADFWISLAAGRRIRDSQSGFRVYPAELLRDGRFPLSRSAEGFVLETELLVAAAYLGYPLRYVPIDSLYPQAARPSHYRAVHDTTQITLAVARMLLDPRLMLPRLRLLFGGRARG